jgi:hypothetical protein
MKRFFPPYYYEFLIFMSPAPSVERRYLRVVVSPTALPLDQAFHQVVRHHLQVWCRSPERKHICQDMRRWCLPSPSLHAALAGPIAEFANQPIGHPYSGCDEVTR